MRNRVRKRSGWAACIGRGENNLLSKLMEVVVRHSKALWLQKKMDTLEEFKGTIDLPI